MTRALALLLALAAAGANAQTLAPPQVASARLAVATGAQRLVADRFAQLDGLRVGLVTNHTARVDTSDGGPAHLIDRLHVAPEVTLGALFGPEHGLRGTEEAGAHVGGGRDPGTGVPVYSLYGAARKPSPAQMAGLDALVFDMQDVGARFYTYISTMGYAMQAAAEAGVPFVVLDRPNPIGGRVEGALLDARHQSFVGLYRIPVTHGLTVGELARMILSERLLPGLDGLDLRVVEMTGYARSMSWEATGLPWVPPSPNIPDVATARVYPGTCFFEGTTASEGRGTMAPFQQVGAPWADGPALAATLNARGLPGVRFEAASFVPRDLPGMATDPKGEGQTLGGVRLVVTDAAAFRPVEAGVHLLDAFYRAAPRAARRRLLKADWLAKLAGTDALRAGLASGRPAAQIVAAWDADAEAFRAARAPYLIYGE
jgi:uncharacterized protein YbbC (DUF1343 family)